MFEAWFSQLPPVSLQADTLRWLAIPLVAALAGLLTNRLVVWLLFHPRDYFGLRPLGWQGLIPFRTRYIARIISANIKHKIGDEETLFARLEPEQITKHLARSIRPHLDSHLDEIMLQHNPVYWENLPIFFKNRFYSHAHRRLEAALDDLVEAIGDNVHRLWHLDSMLEQVLLNDKSILIRLFHEAGDQHFRFLVRAGFGAGFICGLFCMFVQLLFPSWWWAICMLGMISGAVCNWAVLQWIFGPLPTIRLGRFKLQSRIEKEKYLLSEKFADAAANEMITAAHLFDHLLHGPHKKLTRNLIHKHMASIVDATHIKSFAQLSLGLGKFADLKQAMTQKSHELIHQAVQDSFFHQERSQKLRRFVANRLRRLSDKEFNLLMRSAFAEDEIWLIWLGAFLGLTTSVLPLIWIYGQQAFGLTY